MIRVDNEQYDKAVGTAVGSAIMTAAANAVSIDAHTLTEKVEGHKSFTVAELDRLASFTGRTPADFLPTAVTR